MEQREYEIMYVAEESHWWYQGMAAIARKVIETYYSPGLQLRILDAGCGTGSGMLLLSRYGSVTGLDISAHALRFCAGRGCADIGRASVMAFPFREGTFDLMTSLDILYFEGIHDEAALREAARVLRPSGRLLIRVPAFDWLRGTHDARVSTAHRYTSKELSEKLVKSGFEIEFMSYVNMLLFPFALLKRFSERWLPVQKDSDLAVNAGVFSGLFRGCLVLESRLIPKWRLPFGLSVIAMAKKNSRRRSL
ncbi:MAG: class I SAM-dependent methyltransferase [Pseudomonadota bacterium]